MRQFRPTAIRIPERADPVIKALFRLMQAEHLGIKDVSDRSGVAERSIRSWRTTSAPTLPSLQAALGVFGYELVVRKTKAREEEDRLYALHDLGHTAKGDAMLKEMGLL